MTQSTFLDEAEVAVLTGRKQKSMQIEALRKMGLSFWINATGHPVVARSVIEGKTTGIEPPKKTWVPKVLRTQ